MIQIKIWTLNISEGWDGYDKHVVWTLLAPSSDWNRAPVRQSLWIIICEPWHAFLIVNRNISITKSWNNIELGYCRFQQQFVWFQAQFHFSTFNLNSLRLMCETLKTNKITALDLHREECCWSVCVIWRGRAFYQLEVSWFIIFPCWVV